MTDYQDAYQRIEASIGGPELEYIHLSYALQADARYIDGLVKRGDHDTARDYIRTSRFIERRDAWKQGRA